MNETTARRSRLRAEGITVGYGQDAVLPGIDFEVPDGELTVILGPNACGKSTLLKTLSRVLTPSAGKIFLDDAAMDKSRTKDIARVLAMLPQTPEAPSGVSVADVVARGRYPHQSLLRAWTDEDERACVDAMTAANVLSLRERSLEALSGGQRQRVWIAMTLAQDTPLILLDEPTTYLDITHQVEVLNLTRRLHGTGRTIVMVLHDLNLAFRYATRLVLMRDGRIISQGRPREIVDAALIRDVFDLDALVVEDPVTGAPLVVPEESTLQR
ncbi:MULTISPECIES: ABC transporter ATP-binding protein [Micrococcaceae]|uniref:ABC transporter ATP-binding protein n=1 Tax=unclassified Kocuria TaxID=2649579 RepID=UPI001011C48C|nr:MULTISPECIES: ABC transporter ATP-binding protein [unclassified Kocuria]